MQTFIYIHHVEASDSIKTEKFHINRSGIAENLEEILERKKA
jgi:hypothetical protein